MVSSNDTQRNEIDHPENLPLGFEITIQSRIWPDGTGVVHNHQEPCGNTPKNGVLTDLHTIPSNGKRLCENCEWPENAEEALEYDG